MKIQRPGPGILVLEKSLARAAFQVGFFALFFVAWYSFLFAGRGTSGNSPTLFMFLFWLAPLFAVPEIVRQVRVLASGETFTFNRTTGLIERNGTLVARFSDVERVQIRTIAQSEGSDQHRLSIVLKNEEKLRIDQSSDAEEITATAEDIADILGVEVGRKERGKVLSRILGSE